MNKVFLYFEKSFWPKDGNFLEYFKDTSSEMMVYESYSPIGNNNVLIVFLAGKHARKIENMTIEETRDLVVSDLRKIYGSSIPNPSNVYKTGWHTDPFALGSYPHIPPGSKLSHCDRIGNSIDNKIFFAGDATISNYLATAHGAYISGIKAANEILKG
jgi:monoamine oxidase